MSVSATGGGGISGNGKWIDAGRDWFSFWGLIAGGVCYVVLNLIAHETDNKKRHLTMARLELLFVKSNMVASVAMSSITCLIFSKALAYFRYSGLYLRPDERL